MKPSPAIFLAAWALALPTPAVAAAPVAPPTVSQARVAALQQQRFGMLICWSFSTFSGKEWTPGITDVSFFRATGCDTDQWARTAKAAGMGYILFLTKHHDGFCDPADKIYADSLGAVKYGNLFSLDVGPDYAGRLREIDVRTLRQVGEMIRNKAPVSLPVQTRNARSP